MKRQFDFTGWFAARCAAGAIALLVGTQLVAAEATKERLFDFQQGTLAGDWIATGDIVVARGPLPEAADADAKSPRGIGLKLQAKSPAASLQSRSGKVPADWRSVRSIRFWAFRPENAGKDVLDVQLVEADGRTMFWRKVELSHQGWKEIDLPLAWFRWKEGRVPQWDRIDHLTFVARKPLEVWLADVGLVRGTSEAESELTAERLFAAAFPNDLESSLKIVRSPNVFLASDVDALDAAALAEHLGKVVAAIRADMSLPPQRKTPGRLFIFSTPERYQDFLARLAVRLGADPAVQPAAGFTTHGHVAVAYWVASHGWHRPIYTHEFVHSYLGANLLFTNHNEWFHEGAATMYQLQFHPQKELAAQMAKIVDVPGACLPLSDLCNGQPIPMDRYWQAATVVEMLARSEKYRAAFPKLLEAFQQTGSSAIGPHLGGILHTDWQALTADWRAYCKKRAT